jgi:glycosyltransferase involved in cell wall biosynthesis
MTARMSVVIPAHDEGTIIGRSLRSLVNSDARGQLEIVVVANGCQDRTAEIAAAVSQRIRVVEISAASKIAALNAGDDAATEYPRAYLDADVDVTAETLLAVADRLDPAQRVYVGAPRLRVDSSRASLPVRQYYRIWEQSEYRATGHVGSGVYVLSEAGRARFGRFPNVIADDRFVQQLFLDTERVTVEERTFTVSAPRSFGPLLNRSTRIATGNQQIAAVYPALAPAPASSRFAALAKRVAARPWLWTSFPAYCLGYAIPRVRARRIMRAGRIPSWNRDETTRVSE